MACGSACCKFLLFSFNLIIALCSLALFILAIIAQMSISPYYNIEHSHDEVPDIIPTDFSLPMLLWIIIGISGFAFLMAFIGCLGAIRESRCLMFCFASVLAVVLIAELFTIGVGYTMQDQALEQVEANVNASLPYYFTVPEITRFWDALQTDLHCCGVKGPGDWTDIYKNSTLPASCCPQIAFESDGARIAPCTLEDMSNVSETGCMQKVMDQLQGKTIIIYAVAATIGIIEIFGVILACCLGFSISDQYSTV